MNHKGRERTIFTAEKEEISETVEKLSQANVLTQPNRIFSDSLLCVLFFLCAEILDCD